MNKQINLIYIIWDVILQLLINKFVITLYIYIYIYIYT